MEKDSSASIVMQMALLVINGIPDNSLSIKARNTEIDWIPKREQKLMRSSRRKMIDR